MLFTNARIMTMEEAGVIPGGFVRVHGGKIVQVGEMSRCPSDGEDRIDLGGGLLLPGFVDAHSHLGLYGDGLGAEGDDLNEESDPCTPHLRAIDGINPFDRCFTEARAAGVTCAVVSPGSANPVAGQVCAVKTAGRWVDRMAVAQPLAMKFALGENPKMTYGGKSQGPYTRPATAAIIREQLSKAGRYLCGKQKAGNDPELDEPEYDAKNEALIPLLRGEIAAHFHAHKAYDILTAARIAEEFDLEYTIVHCTEGYLIADILARLEAKAVVGPMICARTKPELAGLSLENCAKLIAAGVTVAISTDYPEMPADFLPLSAALAAANGLDRDQALQCITIGAARAAGLEGRVGSIAPGKDADLLVYDEDPLGLYARPGMVYIGGERVV